MEMNGAAVSQTAAALFSLGELDRFPVAENIHLS